MQIFFFVRNKFEFLRFFFVFMFFKSFFFLWAIFNLQKSLQIFTFSVARKSFRIGKVEFFSPVPPTTGLLILFGVTPMFIFFFVVFQKHQRRKESITFATSAKDKDINLIWSFFGEIWRINTPGRERISSFHLKSLRFQKEDPNNLFTLPTGLYAVKMGMQRRH